MCYASRIAASSEKFKKKIDRTNVQCLILEQAFAARKYRILFFSDCSVNILDEMFSINDCKNAKN